MLFKNPLTLAFLVFTFIINVHSQNTYVPDDNFEQFLIDSGLDSGPLDDYVPTNNINTIKTLSISGNANYIWEIKSLEGIQDFTSLESLTIDLNEVTNIDLSSNINLVELKILNDALLENLNISNNVNLEFFQMITTSVATIDLTNNKKLTELIIGTTSLVDIDLIENTNLKRVEITYGIVESINIKNGNNTNIDYFNVEGNFNLSCVRVDDKNYSTTNWTNIDDNSVYSENCGKFAQLTYVPDDNFEQELIDLGYDNGPLDDHVLTSNINTITKLNLNNLNISDLTGIQDFISLEDLFFSNNQLSTVNLSTLLNLKNLYADRNKLSDIDLSNNLLLNWLNINDNNLTTIDLNNNLELTYFYCYNNNLSGTLDLTGNLKLFDLSCNNNPLTEINLPGNNILDGLHVSNTLISELDLRNQANLITHPASFMEIQNTPNLFCVYVDDVDRYNDDVWGAITKDTQSTFVANEAECKALTCSIDVDELNDTETCDSYILPTLNNGNYYTLSGGNGNLLNAGDTITSSQLIYIYKQDNSDPSCFDESSFQVTINLTPNVDTLNDIETCNSYVLPSLNNGIYYTLSGGNGNQLNAGDTITSSQLVYIYSDNGNCDNESSFELIINKIPEVSILSDLQTESSYELPVIQNGNYFTESNGNGNLLNPGDIITNTQKIYIYSTNSSGCSNESSFTITIKNKSAIIPPYFTPNQDNVNDFWIITSDQSIREINIYNRFGTLIASPEPEIGWDGLFNGRKMPSNTYWYKVIYEDNSSQVGSFSLLRK